MLMGHTFIVWLTLLSMRLCCGHYFDWELHTEVQSICDIWILPVATFFGYMSVVGVELVLVCLSPSPVLVGDPPLAIVDIRLVFVQCSQ